MWHTPEGDRTLRGSEADLFRLGVLAIAKRTHRYHPGAYFSRMTAGERLTALASVAQALLDPAEPAPCLYAWNEAAVHAVYRTLQRWASRSRRISRLARRAGEEMGMQEQFDADLGDEDSAPLEPPEIIGVLMDGILWDRDFDFEEEFHEEMEEYFALPPVATPEQVEAATDYFDQLKARRPARKRGKAT